jgi:hypothetical protein
LRRFSQILITLCFICVHLRNLRIKNLSFLLRQFLPFQLHYISCIHLFRRATSSTLPKANNGMAIEAQTPPGERGAASVAGAWVGFITGAGVTVAGAGKDVFVTDGTACCVAASAAWVSAA